MEAKPVKITDTSLRDMHQSPWATRVLIEDIIPILPKIDKVGFFSVEIWDRITFNILLKHLGENPWNRLRTIKKYLVETPCQVLLHGQNLLGYRHYSDDVVYRFVKKAKENGVDIFRIFDALNDVMNLKSPIKAVKEAGGWVEGVIVYTISPVHTLEYYVEIASKMVDFGVDSLCVKDIEGLLTPYHTNQLIERIKKEFDVPIQLHCHFVGEMASMNYLKAIEAGVEVIDTATFPLAFANSRLPTEVIVTALKGTVYDTGIDLGLLYEIADCFEEVAMKRGCERRITSLFQMKTFSHQVPGEMVSEIYTQLQQQNAVGRLPEVLEEIPRVRAEVGYPPLVSPLSQILGMQAIFNVLTGERWSVVPQKMKDYLKGLYGKPPGPFDPEIQKKVLAGEDSLTMRQADLIKETYEDYAREIGDLARGDEDVLSYAFFPEETRAYLERSKEVLEKEVFPVRNREWEALGMNLEELKELIETLDRSEVDELILEKDGVKVTLRKSRSEVAFPAHRKVENEPAVVSKEKEEAGEEIDYSSCPDGWKEITSPMVGTFYRSSHPDAPPFVEEGDVVEPGDTLCVLEAMKLFNEITAEERCKIKKICVENAQPVEYGQTLFLVEPIKDAEN